MAKNPTPHCHACGRVKTTAGWQHLIDKSSPNEVYETLCKDCLSDWTDHLLTQIADSGEDSEKAA